MSNPTCGTPGCYFCMGSGDWTKCPDLQRQEALQEGKPAPEVKRRPYEVLIPVTVRRTEEPDALKATRRERQDYKDDQLHDMLSFKVLARTAGEAGDIVEKALFKAVDRLYWPR